jgi:hypothetical protein
VLTYAFANQDLEQLSGAQRHLVRMGPDNARKIQAKLRKLRVAFGWPEPIVDEEPEPVTASVTGDSHPEPKSDWDVATVGQATE